jgi:hypothetical protein
MGILERAVVPPRITNKEGNTTMKKLLLIALMACGFAFVPAQRSDAQVSVGIGVGYPSYGYRYYPSYGYGYYPYRYYRPYRYYGYYNGRPYYNGHRYYRHHRNHRYYRY